MNYSQFIAKKQLTFHSVGFKTTFPFNKYLFPFQREIVNWALQKGRACLFEDCGLGKTIQQLEWSRHICMKYPNSKILIVAPLAIAEQTKDEGIKIRDRCKYM